MARIKFSRWIGAAVLVVVLSAQALAGQVITVLHTNDQHGDIVALARAATVIERIRKDTPDALVIDAGDFSDENQLMEYVTQGRPVMLDLMKRIGYDAATPGNHDMIAAAVKAPFAKSPIPLLYANITRDVMATSKVKTVPFIVKTVAGVRVGIFGLTVNGSPAVERAREIVPQLRKEADVVILLSHEDSTEDEAIAKAVPGIDLIVGGHTHILVMPPKMVNGTALVIAGAHGEFLGQTEIYLDDAKHVTGVTGRLISLWTPDVTPSAALMPTINPLVLKEGTERLRLGDVIGEATAAFTGSRYDIECAMGNYAADVLRERYKTDVALLRGDVLAPEAQKGPVTVADVYHVIRWDAPAYTVTLSGELLRQALERGLEEQHAYLRMSGVRVWYDLTKPVGRRVIKAEIDGAPLDPKRGYRVATEEWIALGRTGYTMFPKATNVTRTTDDIRGLLIDAIRKAKTITPPGVDRFVDATAVKAAA